MVLWQVLRVSVCLSVSLGRTSQQARAVTDTRKLKVMCGHPNAPCVTSLAPLSICASLRGLELSAGISAKAFTLHSSPHEWAHCGEQSGGSMRITRHGGSLALCHPDLCVPGRPARKAGLEEGSSSQRKSLPKGQVLPLEPCATEPACVQVEMHLSSSCCSNTFTFAV